MNHPGTSSPPGDDQSVRYAVIDAGTNSIKFHIGERDAGGHWRAVVDRAEMTRLGEGLVQDGAIVDAALERTIAAIAGMVDEAKQHGVRTIAAVGTAGLRIAVNGSEVVAAIEKRTGVRVEVISGEEEGRLAYLAAKSGLGLSMGSPDTSSAATSAGALSTVTAVMNELLPIDGSHWAAATCPAES